MTLQLDYATAQTTAVPSKSLMVALVLCLFAVLTTVGIVEHSADLASRAFFALMIPTDCGMGRHAAESELYFQMPWALAAPLILVLLSYGVRTGVLICRCAPWASLVGWATAAFFVYCRYQLC